MFPVAAVVVFALGLLLPAVAGAQQQSAAVEGTVVDAVSNRVAGAAVLLLDSLGFEIARMHRRAIAARLRNSPHDAPLSARLTMLNITNRAYAFNFGNPFSGTHFGAPRTLLVELRMDVR